LQAVSLLAALGASPPYLGDCATICPLRPGVIGQVDGIEIYLRLDITRQSQLVRLIDRLAVLRSRAQSMIPESGNRFSEKIMLKQDAKAG
jgi:hypothetical protein